MSNNQHKDGFDKPEFDLRVKSLMKIEQAYSWLKRLAVLLSASLVIGLMFAFLAKASDVPNLFLVPVVTLTPNGAAVFQPQTGAGYSALSGLNRTTFGQTVVRENGLTSNFAPGGYIAPKYDAFADGSMNQVIPQPETPVHSVEQVDFNIQNNIPGSLDQSYGTTQTTFTFSANVVANDSPAGSLEYRWDFENDGQVDTYFSVVNNISHVYAQPGDYQVKLEVLDYYGRVSSTLKAVHIAQNDAPKAAFKVDKVKGPINTIVNFDSSWSSDDQYPKADLSYRFDWDNDGVFDTNYQNKTVWNHKFDQPGRYDVIMEARDPEGLTAQAEIFIDILGDNAPQALISVEKLGNGSFKFDASHSSDDFTKNANLRFRWDFNYNGKNDIVFDTNWSYSPFYTGNYKTGGSKTVRLQVMDEQGLIDEAFAQIEVPWTTDYVNVAMGLLSK